MIHSIAFLTRSMQGMLTHPHAKPEKVEVKDCTAILSDLRLVKEPDELERIRAAARAADQGMAAAIAGAKAGKTESQVAAEAEYALRQAGAEGFWRTYVSSGPRTGIAHGLPGPRRLETGDLVMIDVHPILGGYSADICRTVCVGRASAEQQRAYALYLEAQQATIALARAGFGPPIHGVGIEFEEAPLPAGHAFFHGEKAPPPLPANVVLAVGNCGLYAGPWGVRVEDTLVVGATEPELLTATPRSLDPGAEASA